MVNSFFDKGYGTEGFDLEPSPLPFLRFRQSRVLVTLKICLSAKIIVAHSMKKR